MINIGSSPYFSLLLFVEVIHKLTISWFEMFSPILKLIWRGFSTAELRNPSSNLSQAIIPAWCQWEFPEGTDAPFTVLKYRAQTVSLDRPCASPNQMSPWNWELILCKVSEGLRRKVTLTWLLATHFKWTSSVLPLISPVFWWKTLTFPWSSLPEEHSHSWHWPTLLVPCNDSHFLQVVMTPGLILLNSTSAYFAR